MNAAVRKFVRVRIPSIVDEFWILYDKDGVNNIV